MTLAQASRGDIIEVVSIPDANIRAQAIRLGIFEGSKLICSEKLPAGPVILQNRNQEVAVGRRLAESIAINILEK